MNPKLRLHLGQLLMESSVLDMENHNLLKETFAGANQILPMFEPPESTLTDHSFNRLPKNKPKKPKANRGRK
jgi:hypothetical protein